MPGDDGLAHRCEICNTDFETAAEVFRHDCAGIEQSRSMHQAVLEAIGDHAEPDDVGAPVGAVIEAVLRREQAGVGAVCAALQDLHANGEVYQPEFDTLRRTQLSFEGEC